MSNQDSDLSSKGQCSLCMSAEVIGNRFYIYYCQNGQTYVEGKDNARYPSIKPVTAKQFLEENDVRGNVPSPAFFPLKASVLSAIMSVADSLYAENPLMTRDYLNKEK